MDAETRRFINEFGLLLEQDGLPRVAGRMYGLLFLSEEPLSLEALADALNASKASISVNGRLLEERGLCERTTRMGDRRDYYQVADDVFARTIERRIAKWRKLHTLIGEVRGRITIESPVVTARIERFDAAHDNMIEIMTSALERWRRHPAAPGTTNPDRTT